MKQNLFVFSTDMQVYSYFLGDVKDSSRKHSKGERDSVVQEYYVLANARRRALPIFSDVARHCVFGLSIVLKYHLWGQEDCELFEFIHINILTLVKCKWVPVVELDRWAQIYTRCDVQPSARFCTKNVLYVYQVSSVKVL